MHRQRRENDIVLAGLPRSGSTLTCHLINKLPDAVALHEPMDVGRFQTLPDRAAMLDSISQFFEKTRRSLRSSGIAISKNIGGVVPANSVGEHRTEDGLRKPAASRNEIYIGKSLPSGFTLVVKHNAAFSALIPELVKRFATYATIRNPVAVLSSWNSVAMAVRDGHGPMAENIDSDLRARLASIPDRLDRQVHLLSWYFDQFSLLPADRIIRYEELVASGGNYLCAITASAADLHEPLKSQNQNPLYNQELTPILVERLLRERDCAFWKFYSRESVEALAN